MLVGLAVPYLELEHTPEASSILPDFAVVCPRSAECEAAAGSWLIMGDAKDCERVRSRIDDGRMLKGFLQVVLGAEFAAAWTGLPGGMTVRSQDQCPGAGHAILDGCAVARPPQG